MIVRVLAVADEVTDALWGQALLDLRPDVILACGDLPFEYLENLVSRSDRPLLYVPGNHDPDLRRSAGLPGLSPLDVPPGPAGCIDIDGSGGRRPGVAVQLVLERRQRGAGGLRRARRGVGLAGGGGDGQQAREHRQGPPHT